MYSRLPGMTFYRGDTFTSRYPLYVTLVGGSVKRSKALSFTAADWAWALVASFPPNTTLIFYEMMKRALKSFLYVSDVSWSSIPFQCEILYKSSRFWYLHCQIFPHSSSTVLFKHTVLFKP